MTWYYNKKVKGDFDAIIEVVTAKLQDEGFGILTEIDVSATLKKKLNVDFRKYRILGACNPPFAYKALQAEDKIGAMLPCNVIVQDLGQGIIEVAAINPKESMQSVKNADLESVADEIGGKLLKVINSL